MESAVATVTYISDEGVETSYPVGETEPEIHIGRHKSCNIRTSNQSVSRYHARVFFDGQSYYLQDNESVNGTFYENERLKPGEPVSIEDGHYLMCGNFEMRFDLDDEDFNRAGNAVPAYADPLEDDESTRFASSPADDDYYPPPPPPAYAPPPPPPPAYAPPPPPPAYQAPPPPPPLPSDPMRAAMAARASAPQVMPPALHDDSLALVDGLRGDLAQRDARIQELKVEVDSLTRRLDEARNDPQKAQLQQDLDSARRAANDLINQGDAAKAEATLLQAQLGAMGGELESARAQIAESNSGSRAEDERHIEALQNELQVLRESLAAAQEKFEEARAGRRNAEELAGLQRMRADANEANANALKSEVARLQQSAQSQIDTSEMVSAAEYDAQVEAREEAETRATKAERELAQLKRTQAAQKAPAELEAQIADLQTRLAQAESRPATPQESPDTTELARLRLQLKAEKGRSAQLEADLAGQTSAAKDDGALLAAQSELAKLRSELAAAKLASAGAADSADLHSQLERLTAANRELQETISANLKRIQRLTAQQAAGGDTEGLTRQVTKLQAELTAALARPTGAGLADPKVVRLVQDLNGFVKSFINEFDAVADSIERMRGEDAGERDEAAGELPESIEKCQNLSQEIKNLVRDLRAAVEAS